VLETYPQNLRLVIMPFPAMESQSSWLAASAALAAHKQMRFQAFREQLFQHEGPISATDLNEMADMVALDIPRFQHDLVSTAIQRLLVHAINSGVARGVTGTPTVFVNQTPLEQIDFDAISKAIQQARPSL